MVVETEKEYSKLLIDNNAVALSEYMIHLSKCIDNEAFNTNLYEFKYVFIDEFQDTDDAQIASFIAMQKKLGFNFFIVGDLKQSIYRFRGATMTAFEKMGCDNDNWLSFTLNINYRSDKRLLSRFDKAFFYMNSINLLKYERDVDELRGVKTNNISNDLLVVPIPYHNSDKMNSTEYYDMLFKAIEEQRQRIAAAVQKVSKPERLQREQKKRDSVHDKKLKSDDRLKKQENRLKNKHDSCKQRKCKPKQHNKQARKTVRETFSQAFKYIKNVYEKEVKKFFGAVAVPILIILLVFAFIIMIFTSVMSGGGFTLGTYAAQDYDLSEAEKYYTKLAYEMNEKSLW